MRGRYLKKAGGFILVTLMLFGTAFVSSSTVQAQHRQRRIVIVRPYPYRFYRPFGWGYGYGPWYPYGNYYSQYVFSDSDSAVSQGYHDGYKTGRDDGKKNKSYDPQRSHYYHDSGFGNYAEVYRSGFSRGYADGYREGRYDRAG
jgi:hypothetical protein